MPNDSNRNFDLVTLLIGSLSSAAAAVVVHHLWRAGTVLGAAATPLLVALFAELLHRPAKRLTLSGRRRYNARGVATAAAGDTPIRIYRSRPRWGAALAIGCVAFILGAAGLTLTEGLLQRSLADGNARTTLLHSAPEARGDGAAVRWIPNDRRGQRLEDRPSERRSAPDRGQGGAEGTDRKTPQMTGPSPVATPAPTTTPSPSPSPLSSPDRSSTPRDTAQPDGSSTRSAEPRPPTDDSQPDPGSDGQPSDPS